MSLETEIRAELVRIGKDTAFRAAEIGISRTTLSKKLNSHVDFTCKELQRIGQVVNVPGWELLRRAVEASDSRDQEVA